MKSINYGLIVVAFGCMTVPAMAQAADTDAATLCRKATETQIKVAEKAREMTGITLRGATTDSQRNEAKQQLKNIEDSISKLKTQEAQSKCLAEYEKNPELVRCLAEAGDAWAAVECAPSR